jgi:hypothetical protein
MRAECVRFAVLRRKVPKKMNDIRLVSPVVCPIDVKCSVAGRLAPSYYEGKLPASISRWRASPASVLDRLAAKEVRRGHDT